MPPYKKSKVLTKKKIKRNTGAKSQAKQISALSSQLSKITSLNFARVRTVWQKANSTINQASTDLIQTPYICPIPYAPCLVDGTPTQNLASKWQDNRFNALFPDGFGKRLIFGTPDAARNSNIGYHTGGVLKYQMILTGNFTNVQVHRFQKVGLFLIKPKRAMADQLAKDRKLMTPRPISIPPLTAYPGGESFLEPDKDFVVHSGNAGDADNTTYFGSEINTKYWTVVHKREVAFSHPGATGVSSNANANNASPANNALTASGSIKLPAGGVLKNASPTSDPNTFDDYVPSALRMNTQDQANENSLYLVAIFNEPQDQAQTRNGISLGLLVQDNYKIVV